MDKTVNTLNWFEIPVTDFERAKKFYETIFSMEMYEMQMGPDRMGMFPSEPGNGKLSGAIVQGEGYVPGTAGPLVFFNGNPDLQDALSKVVKAGGKILKEKTQITPEIGYWAIFIDSEGNRVAMHSGK
jgi:predicted enzyme related to lactoylglutathione lyase